MAEFNELISHIAATQPAPITSASALARHMAARARTLAQTIKRAFQLAEEDEEAASQNRQLQGQLDAFRRVLINDLTPDGFADIYAQKWLKDRKGRTLTFDDIRHYLQIIHALTETGRLMQEIG